MEFTRHARQRLKLYGVSREQATAIVAAGSEDGRDANGNPRYQGQVDGRNVRVIVALDNPSLIITLYVTRN
ncbi:MAG TPA: DUF4258 domain-containing protein [Conexibacter sp.]|jgi:hypothetical protein|nr:DUF4258 domain-containing protein [Conexibacter sp.]